MIEQEITAEFAASFSKILNRHGYGFQYSILQACRDLADNRKSTWQFEESEFPVEIGGASTRIDFILHRVKNFNGFDKNSVFMLAECKRVDPAVGSWCFVRAAVAPGAGAFSPDTGILEYVELDDTNRVNAFAKRGFSYKDFYHLGFELKTNAKGDGVGRSEQVIESSISQVLRGLNGFVEMLQSHPFRLAETKAAYLLPVIFTTAKLFVANVDLSTANQQTGRINVDKENVKSVSWIIYQYPQSPALKYQTEQEKQSKENLTFSQFQYVRSVPIVSADGVEDFLQWASSFETRNLFF